MQAKKILFTGVLGGVANFLLGWIFYGILFKEVYPEGETMNLAFTFLGCLTYAFFMSYVFNIWANISNLVSGLKAGALIGFFTSLSMNFFMYSSKEPNYSSMITDVLITIVMGALTGAVIVLVGKKI